jgi:hypothetical protein
VKRQIGKLTTTRTESVATDPAVTTRTATVFPAKCDGRKKVRVDAVTGCSSA